MNNDTQNVWFGISMGLLGLIVGFGFATYINGQPIGRTQGQQIVQAPNPPNAPTGDNAPAPTPDKATDVVPVDFNRDHIRGNPDATVAIIEYSDYECPFCTRAHPTYKQILDTYGDDVMWVYRHFPLSFHPKAMPAAVASECLYELGGHDAFWKFTDAVFEKGNYDFGAIAKEIGVDQKKFTTCIESGKYNEYINKQMAEGQRSGVNGTPGNIIYNVETREGILAPGARPFEMFKTDIDAMLAAE